MRYYKEMGEICNGADLSLAEIRLKERFIVGKFIDTQRPDFMENYKLRWFLAQRLRSNLKKKAGPHEREAEVRLAGFGGQGIILSGHMLGKAATLFEKKNAVFTQSYGPEASGGSCSADVLIATDTIYYPKVSSPDLLVIMSQGAWTTYGGAFKPGGTLIIDEDLVNIEEFPEGVTVYRVPSTRIAEEMGRE